MKKILCLIDSLGSGGAQRQMVGLAVLLKEAGYDVKVAVYHEELFYADYLKKNHVPYLYYKAAEKNTTRPFKIERLLRKERPNTVISYLDVPNICACVAKIFNKSFKLIVSERSLTLQTGRKEKIRYNLYREADYIVPNSYSQAKYIHENFSFLSGKINVISNFVDLDFFRSKERKTYHSVPQIIVVGSIYQPKNTLLFIEAVKILKDKGLDFCVKWYGKSEANIGYFKECQNKIKRYGINDEIKLLEKTDKIRECYQNSDVFCLPSLYEGTPNVICEAMACGLPIVCSDVSDNSKIVVPNKNGYLFNPYDVNSMVEALDNVLTLTEEQYKEQCNNSREMAEKLFSKTRFVDSYIKLIENEF